MRLVLYHTRIPKGRGLPGKIIRAGVVLFALCFLPSLSQAQITFSPSTDSICVDFPLGVSYSGTWDPGSRWQVTGGGSVSPDVYQPSVTITWSAAGNRTIRARVIVGTPPATIYDTSIVIVDQPVGPVLDIQTPGDTACEGELVSATIIAGTGGVGCSDELQYLTRTGVTWSAPSVYTSGDELSTVGYDEIIVRGRRTGCDGTVGCSGTEWDTLAQWIVIIDTTPPVFSGCPSDINTSADTSYCDTPVTWTEPTVTDNCPGVVVTKSHSPGDVFPIGTTTVTYIATDYVGFTDTCEFDVIVGTATPPVISGPAEVCTPTQETYSVTDPGSHTFSWVVTNGTIVGSSTTPVITVDWTGTTQGTVEVTITSGSLCTSYNSITVDKGVTPFTGIISSSGTLTRR